jgi:hypothetical protein
MPVQRLFGQKPTSPDKTKAQPVLEPFAKAFRYFSYFDLSTVFKENVFLP